MATTPAGRRFFADAPTLKPPFHVGWRLNDGTLLEFPPVIYHTTLFVLGDDGVAKAVDVLNGHTLWAPNRRDARGRITGGGRKPGAVVMPVLSTHGRSPGGGRFVALSMRTGHVVWSKPLPTGSESSPIVHGDDGLLRRPGGHL